MRKIGILILLGILSLPVLANAGLANFFGIGAVAKSIGDTTWKIYGIKTLASMGPLLLLITAVIGAIFVANSVANITKSFADTGREVLSDGKVIGTEKWILIVQTVLSGLAIALLIFVGYYLALLIKAGTNEMLNYTPPAVVEAQTPKEVKK